MRLREPALCTALTNLPPAKIAKAKLAYHSRLRHRLVNNAKAQAFQAPAQFNILASEGKIRIEDAMLDQETPLTRTAPAPKARA